MIKNNVFIMVLFFLVGCAPSYSHWVGGMNAMVGTRFESHIYADCSRGCGDSYWSPVNRNEVFDRVLEEGEDRRFYITWIRDCRYSVLVSKDGIIKSWRYENANTKSCYVF
ncbi:hypothetical protein DWF74_16805 [Pseudomonas protegens]|nr:hypothetical protein DWF74_16805 [Pseudomonas protegens]